MNVDIDSTLGTVVALDYRAAAIFEKHGLDFCCGGKQSLADACRTKTIDPATIVSELRTLDADQSVDDEAGMPLDALVRLIVERHHAYVRRTLPLLRRYLSKLVAVHGGRHPELVQIERTLHDLAGGLEHHMVKEEEILFPYIIGLARADRGEQPPPANMFGTVHHPIRVMELEHEEAGAGMLLIRQLTGGYETPEDGCTTYRVALRELEAFEHDLHRHVHLENNILFPQALELEQGKLGHAR